MLIRRATPDDSMPLAAMIQHTVWVSNTPDYGAENTHRVMGHFSPESVATMMSKRSTYVAVDGHRILGTASIGPGVHTEEIGLRTFFVDPGCQRQGVGAALMAQILSDAQNLKLSQLPVRSSIIAEPFYARHGFAKIEDIWDGDERTILMIKPL